jgi:DNA gyrase subunit A
MNTRQHIASIDIEDEMRNSYIDYSMSVIVSRALPDVRDGLKPVHRRVLFAMNDLTLRHDRPPRKCAKITGDVTGNYHPHGTIAVYDALVRLAQDFSMRYPLIGGQGNFGSVDGDAPAAERYTEARLSELAEEMLRDIDKNTVDMKPNYDESREEPTVLPALVPNLLVNGSSGIAVGMATNIPPHNLGEVTDAIVRVLAHPETTTETLLKIVKGPDFPTGGIIYGRNGIRDAYTTGRGLIQVRARAHIETGPKERESIIITEIPFQVNKGALLEKMGALVQAGTITGISDIRDESDREGMRIVIELKRDTQARVVLNQFYKHTQMQTTFGANMLALVNMRPKTLTLREMIDCYIGHRREVVTRRTQFELDEAERRAHILEGLKIALDHLDAIITLIRKAPDTPTAHAQLVAKFDLSDTQATAILELRLQRLTGLERKKIEEEYREVLKLIERLRAILASDELVRNIIRDEVKELRAKFADERRTEIVSEEGEFEIEDLIADEEMAITISHGGYIKRTPMSLYRRQGRGGRGATGAEAKEEDFVEQLFIASTHSYLLCFTDRGQCYWLKVHEIPQAGRAAKGKAMVNVLDLSHGEKVTAVVPVRSFDDEHYVMLATKNGTIKKTVLSAFSNPRRAGIRAITLDKGDSLIEVVITDGTQDLILAKRQGRAVRFSETQVRAMGRDAAGVRATRLEKDDAVIGMVAVKREGTLLVVTENGYGKRSPISDYPVKGRGAGGVWTIRNTPRNGPVVAIKEVIDSDELMIVTSKGVVLRLPLASVRVQGRTTQGVRLIRLDDGDRVTDVARIVADENGQKKLPTLSVVPPPGEAGITTAEDPEDVEEEEEDEEE